MRIWTARLTYVGPDRIDVTPDGADRNPYGLGAPFAPSCRLVRAWTSGKIPLDEYVRRYTRRLDNIPAGWWASLAARAEVKLVCYCADPERCHRTVLARILAERTGGEYMGER